MVWENKIKFKTNTGNKRPRSNLLQLSEKILISIVTWVYRVFFFYPYLNKLLVVRAQYHCRNVFSARKLIKRSTLFEKKKKIAQIGFIF